MYKGEVLCFFLEGCECFLPGMPDVLGPRLEHCGTCTTADAGETTITTSQVTAAVRVKHELRLHPLKVEQLFHYNRFDPVYRIYKTRGRARQHGRPLPSMPLRRASCR